MPRNSLWTAIVCFAAVLATTSLLAIAPANSQDIGSKTASDETKAANAKLLDLFGGAQSRHLSSADLRQAVENDTFGLNRIICIKDELHGLAEFKIGRIEQTLLLISIHDVFGWQQLENFDGGSSVQPCDAAPLSNSSLVSDKVM